MSDMFTTCYARNKYVIRAMRLEDLDQVHQICLEVNFRHYKHEEELMMKVDPGGLLVAQSVETGKILGICGGINHSNDLAFIGLYCVRSDYRGLGIGSDLWTRILDHIGNERNIGLYARIDMTDKYRNNGFGLMPDRKLNYFIGKVNLNQMIIELVQGISIVAIDVNNIYQVIQYDRSVCDGLDRKSLIKQLPNAPDLVTSVAVDHNNSVVGYGVLGLTNYDRALVLGLYADNEMIAQLLITKLCQLLPIGENRDLEYYCWDSNHKSINIAKKMGLNLLRSQPILFTKKIIDGNLKKIFCVSSRDFYPV